MATKVGLVSAAGSSPGPTASNSPGAVKNGRPEHIRRAIDERLRRLQTDRVDLYQLHRVDEEVPLEETWGAMAEAVAAGKAGEIGLSEVWVEELERAHAVHPVASVQSELSVWTRDALAEVLPYCAGQGIAFLPFSPLGRGFRPGVSPPFDDLPEDDFRPPAAPLPAGRAARQPGDRRRGACGRRPGGCDARPGGAGVGASRRVRQVIPIPGHQDTELPVGERGRGRPHARPPADLADTRRDHRAGRHPLLIRRRGRRRPGSRDSPAAA